MLYGYSLMEPEGFVIVVVVGGGVRPARSYELEDRGLRERVNDGRRTWRDLVLDAYMCVVPPTE